MSGMECFTNRQDHSARRCNSSLRQAESRKWFGCALDYIIELVIPSLGLRVVRESVGEGGLAVLVCKDESKLILFGRGKADGLRCCSAVYIQPYASVLPSLLVPTDEYRCFVLRLPFGVLFP